MLKFSPLICLLMVLVDSAPSWAFKNGTYSAGLGYFSEDVNATSQSASGAKGSLGEANYLFNFKYDYGVSTSWFLAPQLGYTFFPRSTPGSTATVSITNLIFQIGQNAGDSYSSAWDWYAGPGIEMYSIKGSGGTTVMNNGTGTATFAVPGRSSTVQKVTFNLGGSYVVNRSRIGLDLIFENFFSSTKRAENLMLSYAYQFGGGL